MITSVCLNPAIDQNAEVDQIRVGGMNRLVDLRSFAAGKGINVAVVLARLGAAVRCIGFVGDSDVLYFKQSMRHEGVPFDALTVPGSVRRNLKLVEADSRMVTELNQTGARVDSKARERLEAILVQRSETGGLTAMCGSLPPGCAPDTYQTIMRKLPDRQWIVDASGEAMREALKAKPYLIKPNQAELEEIVATGLDSLDAVQNAAVSLCRTGVSYVAASLGERGALVTDGRRTIYAPAVSVKTLFTVGGGDALLAGILYGMDQGETPFDSLRYGIAAAAACVEGGSIQAFTKERFFELLTKVEIRNI